MEKQGLIILSGGMDSTTLLYQHAQTIALAVSFDYGSKHNARELPCAAYHCAELGIEHLVIPLAFIGKYFRSDLLLSGGEIPEGKYAPENMSATVVPFRNGIMLSVAAGIAESRILNRVLIANHFGDHAIYPDCRSGFISSISQAVLQGTTNGVQVEAPYTSLTKTDIAHIGGRLGIDYSHTWSCYKGGRIQCGCCATCLERREALKEAGIKDTTLYAD